MSETTQKSVAIVEDGGQRWHIKGKADEAEGFVTIGYVKEIGSQPSANLIHLASAIGYREFLIIDRKHGMSHPLTVSPKA